MKSGVIFSFSLLLIILARAQENGLSTARELEQNGALKESFEAYEKAANAFYEAEAFEEYASAYLRMANLALQMGNAIQAKELAERTLAFLEVENPAEIAKIAEAKTLLGRSLLSLAQNDDALQVLLVAETKLEESEVKATCLDAIGQAYTNNENFELAAQYLERGLKMRRSLFGNKSIEAGNSFNNLGRVYATEDPLQAIIYFTRALNIYKTSLGENDRRTLRAKINIAFSNRELENYDEAIELLQSVLAAYERQFGKENTNVAFVLSNIGRILKDQKKYEQTLVYQQDALKIYIQLYGEKHQEVANTYYLIGEAHLANQSYKTALSFYQKSVYANLPTENSKSDYDLPEMRNFLNGDVLLTCLRGKAYALEYLHYQKSLNVKDLVAAVDTYAKCDDLITEIRRKRLNERDKFRLGKLAKEIYESGIALSLNLSEGSLRKKKYQQKAFEFCERSKSSVLLEAITESKAKKFAGIPKNLVALEDSIKEEISHIEQELVAEEKDNEVLKELLFTYQLSYRNYIENLEKEYPEYYKLKYDSKIASIPELQAQISDNTAILSYFLGDEETFLFSITQDKVLVSRRPSSGKLERLLKGFSNAIRFKMETALTSTSADLRDLLIPSLPSKINQLVIIPDGPLGKLPFEALISKKENRFLLQNYRVSYDYSATLLLNRKKEDETESPQILLMAPVEFDNQDVNLGSLPGTREEIEEIALLFRGNNHKAALKIGPAASESNLKNIPPEPYQFLHLATHGVVNEFSPALSRIFLTGGEDEDGSLYTGEIYNLKIDADLVTLSACETGLGKESKGEGIVGLSRALQYAGANNIIVSLWQVGDQSTSDLMIEFYKYYLHNTHHGYNTALRQAKLSLLNSQSYQSPYYWAPFILVGR